MTKEPDWATVSHEMAALLDTEDRRRYPSIRTIGRYLSIVVGHAFVRWDGHEAKVNAVGYIVAALVAFAVLWFGMDPEDPRMQLLLIKIAGALAISLLLWLVVLSLVVSPARIWDAQQRSIVSLLEAIDDRRNIESLTVRLLGMQGEGLSFLSDITEHGTVDERKVKEWMGELRQAISDAGPVYQSKFVGKTAELWRDSGDHGQMMVGLVEFVSEVVSDLEAQHPRVTRETKSVTL